MRTQLTRSLVEKYDPDTTIGAAWDLVQIEVSIPNQEWHNGVTGTIQHNLDSFS